MKSNKYKAVLLLILVSIFGLNIYFYFVDKNPLTQAKKQLYSLSAGDSYYGRLNLWFQFAQKNNWSQTDKLEKGLDPLDITAYKSNHHPSELKKRLEILNHKNDKNADNWMEMAKIHTILGDKQKASADVAEAYKLDPIRDDIQKVYFSSSSFPSVSPSPSSSPSF